MNRFQQKCHRRLAHMTTLALLAAVCLASVALAGGGSEEACVGNLCFRGGGSFSPKRLSMTKQTPIALTLEGEIQEKDGSHPPALTKAVVEIDKNAMIDVKGYPTCRPSRIRSVDTRQAEAACGTAIIGIGTADYEVKLAEQPPPVVLDPQIIVFNGGVKGGVTTLYIHADVTVPVLQPIIATVKIKKIHHGRYGTEAIATIPPIANGNGSVRTFQLKIDKKFTYKGNRVSVLTAKCPDDRLQAHTTVYFADGTRLSTEFVRPCRGV